MGVYMWLDETTVGQSFNYVSGNIENGPGEREVYVNFPGSFVFTFLKYQGRIFK